MTKRDHLYERTFRKKLSFYQVQTHTYTDTHTHTFYNLYYIINGLQSHLKP